MKSTLWWLGLTFGTLSVVMLVKHGFDYGFVTPLQLILDYYEQVMQVLFGWAEPWIQGRLAALKAWLGWDPHLYPHWKHVFVVMWLYFGSFAVAAVGSNSADDRGVGIVLGGLGAGIAVSVSVIVGTFPIRENSESVANGALLAAIPLGGIASWHLSQQVLTRLLVRIWGTAPGDYTFATPTWTVAVFLILVLVSSISPNKPLVLSGLMLLFGFLLCVAIAILAEHVYWAFRRGAALGNLREQLGILPRLRGVLVPVRILSIAAGVVLFVLTSAGLKLAGL